MMDPTRMDVDTPRRRKRCHGNRNSQRFRRKCRARNIKPKKIEKLLKKRNRQREIILARKAGRPVPPPNTQQPTSTSRVVPTGSSPARMTTATTTVSMVRRKRKRENLSQEARSAPSTISKSVSSMSITMSPSKKRIKDKKKKKKKNDEALSFSRMLELNYRRPMYLKRSPTILFSALKQSLGCSLKIKEEKDFIYQRTILFDQLYCLTVHLQLWESYFEIGRQKRQWPDRLYALAETTDPRECEEYIVPYVELIKKELGRFERRLSEQESSSSPMQKLNMGQIDRVLNKYVDSQRNYLVKRKTQELARFQQQTAEKASLASLSALSLRNDQKETLERMMAIRQQQIKVLEDMLKLEMQIQCKFLPIEFHQLQQFIAPISYAPVQRGSEAIEFKNRYQKNIQETKRVWLNMILQIHEVRLQAYEQQFQQHDRQLEASFSTIRTPTAVEQQTSPFNKIREYVILQTKQWKQEVQARMSTFRRVLLRHRRQCSAGQEMIGVAPEPYLDLDSNPFHPREWAQLSLGPSFIRLNQTALRSAAQQKVEIKRECSEISKKVKNYLTSTPHLVSSSSPYFTQCSIKLENYFHHSYLFAPIPYNDQLRALQQLNTNKAIRRQLKQKDLIIRVTDKSHNFYIGSRQAFEEKAARFFRETNAFEELTENPLHVIDGKVISLLNMLRQSGSISKKQYDEMVPDRTRYELAHLYFNPKTHKDGIPVRPIENTIHAPTTKISKFLDAAIRPIFNEKCRETNLVDSTSFLKRMLEYQKQGRLKPSTVFCTFDIRNLYTMLPQEEALNILMNFLHTHNQHKVQGISLDTIRKLASIVIKENVFVYNKKIYRQVMGGAMGSSFTMTLANVFMWQWEREFRRQREINGEIYGRYIDDIFMTWNGSDKDLHTLLNEANGWHPCIKLDFKIGKSLPFLDMMITNNQGTLATSVYHKPSAEPYITPFISDHPRHIFVNLVRNSLRRALHLSSTYEAFDQERRYIKLTLLYNGYPSTFIEGEFRRFFGEHLSSTSILPFIHTEAQFRLMHHRLDSSVSSNRSAVASSTATMSSALQPSSSLDAPTTITTATVADAKATKYKNTLFIHHRYEKRFKSMKRDLHMVHHELLDQSLSKNAKMIVGTRNRRSARHELIRKKPPPFLLRNKKREKKNYRTTQSKDTVTVTRL